MPGPCPTSTYCINTCINTPPDRQSRAQSEPKRLKKVFPKLIKGIGAEDRLLLVGLTSAPWDGDKSMTSMYNKILLVPRPDYASRHRTRLLHSYD